ncbi:hypothetical protein N7510_003629 [Penicillium lagena]|uniref:uncharacterized protein n=1 Tax=Penicillium lagena TaxID=94218 RepID=UPI0025403998|nr:uncharacterized protein N7510_003629 [Penicillium lagena]KAJ5619645.1 hypothetical protein N7510_003629 [Penicillium lagena]
MHLVLSATLGLLVSSTLVSAQTYTNCNPLSQTCPADPALGRADQTFDFTQGSSSDFTAQGNVEYDSTNGATFTIRQEGDGPLIQSNWYIMFGRVEYQIKAASGRGIVSSAVMQSDDLDEIDWEWLGVNNAQVQTNYFGKGDTSSYNRGAFHDNAGNQDSYHTYAVDWTSEQIVWSIDGQTIRVLTPDTADPGQYPQTPMMVKVGVWAGGDPSNAAGTIAWAGGETDYSQGPFTMYMKWLKVTDYSTGTSYSYSDKSGSWKSITADGGQVNGNSAAEPKSTQSAPTVTETVASVPIPWSGTHKETASFVTPDVWPFVTTGAPSGSSYPSGWANGSGHVKPPGGGSVSEHFPAPSTPYRISNSITKTDPPLLQSTPLFLSPSLPSASAVSSHFVHKTSHRITTRTLTTSTSSKTTTTHTTKTTSSTASSASSLPTNTAAPSVNDASVFSPQAILAVSWVLLGGIMVVML